MSPPLRLLSQSRALSTVGKALPTAQNHWALPPAQPPPTPPRTPHHDSLIKVPVETNLPKRAQVVIAGSGLIGNSVAYHLVEQGWTDIVIVDKGGIADGTSKHGSGMLGLFRPMHERQIVQHCIELYRSLQKKGFDIGLDECGSLNLANSRDRMLSLRRRANRYIPTGLECHVLSPSELKEKHPYMYTEDLQGGIWVPEDATVHPKKVSEALAYLAYAGGARFVGKCGVTKVSTHASNELGPISNQNVRVAGVETEKGNIECEYFINCAGIWARHIGLMSNPVVKVPVCPAEHFFLTFKPIPDLAGMQLPNVRDYDNHTYFRTFQQSFMMGAFEREARPWDPVKLAKEKNEALKAGEDPESFRLRQVQDHWKHMADYISSATKRMPILKETEYDFLLNTPDAFTPDGRWILGEAPEVGNYYVCAGMNGNSLQGAGGVGKVIADWVITGHAPGNMLQFEVQRFTNLHNNPRYLFQRTHEVVGRHYSLQYPLVNEFQFGRKIRTSPIFSELEARGAVFGERMGWERPLYFDPFHSRDDPPAELPKGTFGKPEFFDQIEEEYLVCREGVGIIDMSSFAKFQIKGDPTSVVTYLQNLCCNDIDVSPGEIVSTGMLNERGGFENDCMLIRQSKNSFFMVSPTQQQTRVLEWMMNHLPEDNAVSLQDVTSMYTVLTVAGPKAGKLLKEMTHSDVDMKPFTYKYVNLGFASGVMVFAVTATGEPGYSLYVPSDHALHLYDNIMSVGYHYGVHNVGHLAMRFLRIEKFIPFWGEELTAETTPIETGKLNKVNFDKGSFIGKTALLEQRDKGVTKKLVQLQCKMFDKDKDLWPWGGEAVYRNGEYVGYITNSAYGFTLHKMICLGFVQHPDTIQGSPKILEEAWLTDKGAKWEINIAGKMIPCSLHIHPPVIPMFDRDKKDTTPPKPKPGHAPIVDILVKKEQPDEKGKKK